MVYLQAGPLAHQTCITKEFSMILQNFTFPRAIALLDEIPYPPEKIAFLDLETKAYGRKNSHILYLGLIFLENSTWQVRQWLPEEPEEEKTMLQEVISLLPCFSCLIHYNGNSFDLPVLTKRCSALNLPLDLSQMESVDLYRAFAPLKKLLGFPHLDQRSLENFLGLERTGIFINDLLQLPGLLPLFSYLALLEGGFSVTSASLKGGDSEEPALSIQAELLKPVPKPFSLHLPTGYLSCEEKEFGFLMYGIRDTLKYFYPDYQNYYYLPEEDMVIHKSIADSVDPSYRKKATKNTCYTKKAGIFLPQSSPWFHPAFYRDRKDKTCYLLMDDRLLQQPQLLHDCVFHSLV